MTEKPITVPQKSKETANKVRHWKVFGLVLFCFVAAFFGSWAAIESGFVKSREDVLREESTTVISQEGEVIADLVENISPSVVSIVTSSTTNSFYGPTESQGAGTGIIVSQDGYIVTNKHVIPESATEVEVVMSDGTVHDDVEVIGRDPSNDIAFLKINNVDNLQTAPLGDSNNVRVGQKVIAIGNALGQFQNSVTQGIISGIGRPIQAQGADATAESLANLFQTDAAINPGNSGGPLLTIEGEVIGINTAIVEDAQGIGFAIPINDAKGLLEGVLANGQVTKPYLGVQYIGLDASIARQLNAQLDKGALVYASRGNPVVSGSPADEAGLESGDIIMRVNDQEVNERASLASLLNFHAPGDTIVLTIHRDGNEQQIEVTLTEFER